MAAYPPSSTTRSATVSARMREDGSLVGVG